MRFPRLSWCSCNRSEFTLMAFGVFIPFIHSPFSLLRLLCSISLHLHILLCFLWAWTADASLSLLPVPHINHMLYYGYRSGIVNQLKTLVHDTTCENFFGRNLFRGNAVCKFALVEMVAEMPFYRLLSTIISNNVRVPVLLRPYTIGKTLICPCSSFRFRIPSSPSSVVDSRASVVPVNPANSPTGITSILLDPENIVMKQCSTSALVN